MGAGLWIPFAVPSVGVLCSRAWWEASSESPWVFDDASRLHDLKRPSLFRRDQVPARNTDRPSGFAFTNLKKFLGVPRGGFSKTLLGRVWDSVPQKERASQCIGARLFRRDKISARNTDRPSGFAFTLPKKFLRVPRGVFSKTPLGGEWDGVPGEVRPCGRRISLLLFYCGKQLIFVFLLDNAIDLVYTSISNKCCATTDSKGGQYATQHIVSEGRNPDCSR